MLYIIAAILSVLIIALDQFTKYLITSNLILGLHSIPILKGLINIVYVENEFDKFQFVE